MRGGSKPGERRGGRKKGTLNKANKDLRALAQKYTAEAVEKLATIMRTGESEQAQVGAAKELLDRGHGKATQPLDHGGSALEGLLDALAGASGST